MHEDQQIKSENKTLRKTIRKFRMEKKKQTRNASIQNAKKETEHETLWKLGCKSLPTNFAKLLSAEIDKQTKSKRGRRDDPEF